MKTDLWVKCPNCEGKGKIINNFQVLEICPTCNGKGIISEVTGLPPNNMCKNNFTPINITSLSVLTNPFRYDTNITCVDGSKAEPLKMEVKSMYGEPGLIVGGIFEYGKIDKISDYQTSCTSNKKLKYKQYGTK